MAYVILSNLRVVLFFVYFIVKNSKNVFICRLAISNIVVYRTIIILNILNKVVNYIKLRVVKDWLT